MMRKVPSAFFELAVYTGSLQELHRGPVNRPDAGFRYWRPLMRWIERKEIDPGSMLER